MKDLKEKLEKLVDADDCELIGKLATDKTKREIFARLASPLRVTAADVERVVAQRQQLAKRNSYEGLRPRRAEEPTLFGPALFHREPVQHAIGSGYLRAPLQYCRNMFCERSRTRKILDYL
jgi:hypothetical protein